MPRPSHATVRACCQCTCDIMVDAAWYAWSRKVSRRIGEDSKSGVAGWPQSLATGLLLPAPLLRHNIYGGIVLTHVLHDNLDAQRHKAGWKSCLQLHMCMIITWRSFCDRNEMPKPAVSKDRPGTSQRWIDSTSSRAEERGSGPLRVLEYPVN